MNRCIRLFALVLALIVLTAGALAEGTLTPMQTLDGAEWIDGTSLLAIETDGLEAMANLDGTALTEAVYTNFDSDYGVVTAARPDVDAYNAYGALRADGTELMPFVYGDIEVLSPEWAVGYKLTEADSSNYDYTVLLGGRRLPADRHGGRLQPAHRRVPRHVHARRVCRRHGGGPFAER